MRAILAWLCLVSLSAHAGWEFSAPVDVGAAQGKTVFHHLESANRKALGESGGRVALVWEDNRAGDPRCWLAVRRNNRGQTTVYSRASHIRRITACGLIRPTPIVMS